MFYVSIPRAALAPSGKALQGRLREVMAMSPQWRMMNMRGSRQGGAVSARRGFVT